MARPDILGMIVHFLVIASLPPSRDGCVASTLWLSSRRNWNVDPAREDVDGFDTLGNLVMSVGLPSSSTCRIFFIAQIVKF